MSSEDSIPRAYRKRLRMTCNEGAGYKRPTPEQIEKENARIAICLNCTKKKCTGLCEKFRS